MGRMDWCETRVLGCPSSWTDDAYHQCVATLSCCSSDELQCNPLLESQVKGWYTWVLVLGYILVTQPVEHAALQPQIVALMKMVLHRHFGHARYAGRPAGLSPPAASGLQLKKKRTESLQATRLSWAP